MVKGKFNVTSVNFLHLFAGYCIDDILVLELQRTSCMFPVFGSKNGSVKCVFQVLCSSGNRNSVLLSCQSYNM